MHKAEFIKAIKRAEAIYVNVRFFEHDCYYIAVTKAEMLRFADNQLDSVKFKAEEHDGSLWID